MRYWLLLFLVSISCSGQPVGFYDPAMAPPSLSQGLKGYWRMDESSGNCVDATGRGNNLTQHNGIGSAAGKINSSREFTARNQYAVLTNTANLGFGDKSFTVACWCYVSATNLAQVYISQYSASQFRFQLFSNANQPPWFALYKPNNTPLATVVLSFAIPASSWVYLVAFYDVVNQLSGLSMNGSAPVTIAATGGINTNNILFSIGEYDGFLSGRIDEVAYWDRPLTSAEIAQLYAGYVGTPYPSFRHRRDGRFISLAPMPEPREQFGCEALGNDIYVTAGGTVAAYNSHTFAYSITNNTWTQKADYPLAAESIGLRAVGGKLYGFGGFKSPEHTNYHQVFEYDPGTDAWAPKANMPIGVEDFGSCVISNKIYVAGGLSTNVPMTISPFLQVYDPLGDAWTTNYATMSLPRCLGDFSATDGTNMYVIAGTGDVSQYNTQGKLRATLECDVYSPGGNTWTRLADCLFGTCYKEVEYYSGKLYAVGGAMQNYTTTSASVQIYDIQSNTWSWSYDMPYGARGSGLAIVNGAIYIAGGTDYKGTRSDFSVLIP